MPHRLAQRNADRRGVRLGRLSFLATDDVAEGLRASRDVR